MTSLGMFEMHMSFSCWEKVINAYNYSKSSQIKFWFVGFVHVLGVYDKL
jgi:hypothetical protein